MNDVFHFSGIENLKNFVTFTEQTFDDLIHTHPIVVVDFWAKWCVPCQGFGKTFVEMAQEFPDFIFATVNIEEETGLAEDFQIRSVPFVMIIREGVIIYAEAGQIPSSAFKTLLLQTREVDVTSVKKPAKEDL